MKEDLSKNSVFKEVVPDFLSPSIGRPYKLFRYGKLESRYYFEFFEDNSKKTYISVTSLSSKLLGMNYGFMEWKMRLGAMADVVKAQTAAFGSAFHEQAMLPLKGTHPVHGKGYNFDWLSELSEENPKATNFEMLFSVEHRMHAGKWLYMFKKGLMSWFKFLQDKVVDVWAVEIPLRSKTKGLALTADFIAVIKFYKKDTPCIIDLKSHMFSMGSKEVKKKFYESHQFQLEAQKFVWNENFPDKKISHVFNWAPNSWRDSPTYNLQNQTANKFADTVTIDLGKYSKKMTRMEAMLTHAKAMELDKPPTSVGDIRGSFEDINQFDFNNHILNIKL